MGNLVPVGAEDLSRLTANDFTLTQKGKLAVSLGDQRLTRQQLALLEAIAFLQDSRIIEWGEAYALAEETPGICPVCKFDYASDPDNFCLCTAPHPDDAEEEARALAVSARHRTAKANADLAEALAADERELQELGRAFKARPAEGAEVIPMQGRRRRKRSL